MLREYSKINPTIQALKTGRIVHWKGRTKAGIMLMEYLYSTPASCEENPAYKTLTWA